MKKAQFEQPFVIILGVVVIVLVIVLGANVIRNSLSLGKDVELNVFVDKFKNEAENCFNLDKGSICSLDKLKIPNSLNYICMINLDQNVDYNRLPEVIKETVKNSVETGRDENVFFVPLNLKDEKLSLNLENLKASENPFCSKVINGKVNLALENKGTFLEAIQK